MSEKELDELEPEKKKFVEEFRAAHQKMVDTSMGRVGSEVKDGEGKEVAKEEGGGEGEENTDKMDVDPVEGNDYGDPSRKFSIGTMRVYMGEETKGKTDEEVEEELPSGTCATKQLLNEELMSSEVSDDLDGC